MSSPPTGTVTFLFTDIEGSTKHWEEQPQEMQPALARHDALLRKAIETNGGYIFKTVGDAFCAAFPTPHGALSAALQAQGSMLGGPGAGEQALKVRMALHTGVTEERDGDYFGPPVNRVARLLSAGHGGQTLMSNPTNDLVRDSLPHGVTLLDMGEHRLKDLIRPERIFQLVVPGLPSDFPALKTLSNHPNNLPVQLTSFIGRVKEVGEICTVLARADVHLLTLTGPGGTGKTRLALQAGAEMLEEFKDGVWLAELAALVDHNFVVSTIAQSLGVTEAAGHSLIESLKEYLHEKQILLVLDNFEQVAEAAAQVGQLLAAAPGLTILVTSRVPLKIRGEKEYAVPPLGLPPARAWTHLAGTQGTQHLSAIQLTQYEAVRLFIERATDVKADFEVTNENAPAVAEICVRLDGLPLAIELAAARVRLFPPQALLGRLSSRLEMLTGGAKDLTARQQTLRGAIDWSYDLLDEGEKQFFRRMAVFQGGRTLEGLEAVCNADRLLQADVLEGVESLVSSNLLQQKEGSDGEPRFWILETIHEYAREKLQESGEGEALQREHAAYFMALAEEAAPQLTGAKQSEWLHRLEEEHDNMRGALRWSRQHGEKGERGDKEAVVVGLRLAGALWWFWDMRGYFSEGREQLAAVLSGGQQGQGEFERAARARALNGAGYFAWEQGDYAVARSLHEESLAIRRELGDKWGIAQSLSNLGNVTNRQGDYAAGRSLYEESLSMMRELGDKWGIAQSLSNLGNLAWMQGDYAATRCLHEESLSMMRELGDTYRIALTLGNLGILEYMQGDYAAALSLHEESLAIRRELGDKSGIAWSLNNLGNVTNRQGDYATACSLYGESLSILRELGDKMGIAISLAGLGGVAAGMGQAKAQMQGQAQAQAERGARLLGAAEALLEAISTVLDPDDRMVYERGIASTRAQLSEAEFERAWTEGRAMSMEQAIAYALENN